MTARAAACRPRAAGRPDSPEDRPPTQPVSSATATVPLSRRRSQAKVRMSTARETARRLAGAHRPHRRASATGPRHGAARPEQGRRLPGHSPMAANISTGSTARWRWTTAAHGYALSIAAAKHLANAMCYDDMIRVADLKTRSTRDARVRREVGVEGRRDPAGDRIFPSAHRGILRHHAGRPRPLHRERARSSPPSSTAASIAAAASAPTVFPASPRSGWSAACAAGGARLLRHEVETAHLERWYAAGARSCRRGLRARRRDPQLPPADQGLQRHPCPRAVEIRPRAVGAADLLKGRPDAADWLRRLREAALKDEKGDMLDGALKTVATLDTVAG